MKKATLLALTVLLFRGVCGQSGITGSCRNGGDYPYCVGGEVVFTGSGYPAQVHIKVTTASGKVIDDGNYTTNDGTLSFTENLSFADTYTVTVDDKTALLVSTK